MPGPFGSMIKLIRIVLIWICCAASAFASIQERDSNNAVLVTYTRGLDFSGGVNGAGGIGGLLARTDSSGSTFYHADGSGNLTALMDGMQNIVARYEYDPYGRMIGQWGKMALANTMRFSSMPFLQNSGLIGYHARFYEPGFQRWLNRDPIGEAGGMNLYGFVGNGPVNETDPFGLDYGAVIPRADGTYLNIWDPGHPIGPFPPFTNPIAAARVAVGSIDWNFYNIITPPKWLLKNKCNKFVGDCISECSNRPKPIIKDKVGNKRYPTASEWVDPNIDIPGYGPPHTNPKPGDVVGDGNHVGFMDEYGYIEASSYGPVKHLPFNNSLWNPSYGRSPIP